MKDKTFLSMSQKNTSNANIFRIQRSMFTVISNIFFFWDEISIQYFIQLRGHFMKKTGAGLTHLNFKKRYH